MPDEDPFMTTDEVAATTRLASGTLRQWRHNRRGPASVRLGGKVLYRRSAVLDWIADEERASATTSAVA